MPTPLPARRPFWRRHRLSPDAARNLLSTCAEFMLALVCVSVAVLAIARFNVADAGHSPATNVLVQPSFAP